jgi:hypothetical protein
MGNSGLIRRTDQNNNIILKEDSKKYTLLLHKQYITSENNNNNEEDYISTWSDDQKKYYDVLLEITKYEILCLRNQQNIKSNINENQLIEEHVFIIKPEERKKELTKQRSVLSKKLSHPQFEEVYLKVIKHPLRLEYNKLSKK